MPNLQMLLAYAFSNGGRIRMNEKVYINNEPLIETPHYKNILILCFLPGSVDLQL